MFKPGNLVRLCRLPPGVDQLPLPTQKIFNFCLGGTYSISEIDQNGLLVLDVSTDTDRRFGGIMNDIRVEEECVDPVVRPDSIVYAMGGVGLNHWNEIVRGIPLLRSFKGTTLDKDLWEPKLERFRQSARRWREADFAVHLAAPDIPPSRLLESRTISQYQRSSRTYLRRSVSATAVDDLVRFVSILRSHLVGPAVTLAIYGDDVIPYVSVPGRHNDGLDRLVGEKPDYIRLLNDAMVAIQPLTRAQLETSGFRPAVEWHRQAQHTRDTGASHPLEAALYWVSIEVLALAHHQRVAPKTKKPADLRMVLNFLAARGFDVKKGAELTKYVNDWCEARNYAFHEGRSHPNENTWLIRIGQIARFCGYLLFDALGIDIGRDRVLKQIRAFRP